jgi:hypothetical protein
MKRILFLPLILIFLVPGVTFSQEDGDLENQFYFRFGASIPSWKYRGLEGKDKYADDIKRGGGIFEMGSIFMLNSLKLAKGMRIGINVDYLSLNFNRFKSKDHENKFTTFFWGLKVGPSFSYSPVKKITFDTYIKFNPVWLSTAVYAPYKSSASPKPDPEIYIDFFAPKLSVGLNVRLAAFMLGFEYNPGLMKYKYYDQDQEELVDHYIGRNDDVGSDKTPTPCYNATLGFSF